MSVVLGLLASEGVAQQWEAVARFVHRQPFGVADPLFGKDVGFYMFELPVWRLFHVVARLAVVSLAIFALRAHLFDCASRRVAHVEVRCWRTGRGVTCSAWQPPSVLLESAATIGFPCLNFCTPGNSTTIFGATYTDWYARAVALRVLIVIALLTAVLLLLNIARPRLRTVATATVVWLGASIVLGGIYPGLLQRFIVEPNELEREQPFIEHHLRFTRLAYGLEAIEEVDFEVDQRLDVGRFGGQRHRV